MRQGSTRVATLLLGLGIACGGQSKPESVSTSTPAIAADTLYQRMGGIDVLRGIVDAWILEAAGDARIRDFFRDADIGRVKLRMVERICVLVEGPCMYRGAELREHHSALGIEERHMRAFLEDVEPALERAGLSPDVAQELREALIVLGAQIGRDLGE